MTTNERLLLEMLRAVTLVLRVLLGHTEMAHAQSARNIATDVFTDDSYRALTPAMRAVFADAGTAITDAAGAVKGLKP